MQSSSAFREDPITNEAVTSLPSAPLSHTRKIGRTRRTVTSRFKGFDDDFDSPIELESIPAAQMQGGAPVSQNLGLFVSQSEKVDFDHQSSNAALIQTRSSRKRASPPPLLEEEEENVLDQLAPAAARLKRRRLADEQARRKRGEPPIAPPPPVAEPEAEPISTRHKKKKPEMDVLEVARQQREKEEAIARAEREALEEAMDGMDIEQIRNLAVVEEMDVKRTAPRPRLVSRADESDRWDERWNGRKNFKGFRRRGEGGLRAMNKVIVQLEEVKKKDFGIGDEYWLEGERDIQKKKKGKGRASESQPIDNVKLEPLRSRGHAGEADTVDDTEIIESSAVSHRASLGSQKLLNKANVPQSRPSPNKRAAEPLAKPAPIKKARQSTRRQDSDDSEDGLGFRFRKKK
jgi:nibrin